MASLLRFTQRYPLLFSLLITLISLYGPQLVTPYLGDAMEARHLTSVALRSLFAAVLLQGFGWWREAGFVRPTWRQSLQVFWPLMVIPVLTLISAIPKLGGLERTLFYLLFTFLIAFSEEALLRGLSLRALLPTGTVRAVVASSAVFGLAHLSNLQAGVPLGFVLMQTLGATFMGIAWAGARLRAGSIWPAVLVHMLQNFATMAGSGLEGLGRNMPADVPPLAMALVSLLYLPFAWYGLRLTRAYTAAKASPA